MDHHIQTSRREWLKQTAKGAVLAAGCQEIGWAIEESVQKLPVAAVVTEYRKNSHADVIVGKILEGYDQQGGAGPGLKVVSIFTDQVPQDDLSRSLAKKYGFRICRTIEESLTLGTGNIQVAGVLSIGEHGNYPDLEATGQKMYPRRRFFDEITATFRKAGSVVPVFNDKHLAYNFADALHIYETSQKHEIPFMAGSSIPLAWRRPPLLLPRECEIEEAIAIGYGDDEAYGFHAIEGLLCMIERRKGGETGVKKVQAVRGEEIWKAEKERRWSRELYQAALDRMPPDDCGTLKSDLKPNDPFYLFESKDGLKSCVAMSSGVSRHFGFAAKLKGQKEPVATWYELDLKEPFGHFAYLLRAINQMFQTGKPAYPVERTLLATGMLDNVMRSLANHSRQYQTPHLKIAYQPNDWPFANTGSS